MLGLSSAVQNWGVKQGREKNGNSQEDGMTPVMQSRDRVEGEDRKPHAGRIMFAIGRKEGEHVEN